jgi:GNAT superfamily N-acetyltransferase
MIKFVIASETTNKSMDKNSVMIRQLAENDAAALVNFYNCLSPTSKRTFRPLGEKTTLEVCQRIVSENLSLPTKRYDLTCWHAAELVGWAFIADLSGDCPEVGLAVADLWQNKKIGKNLLGQLLGWAGNNGLPKVCLIVVTDNQRAIHLYKNHGFVIYGEKFDQADQLSYFQMVANLANPA